MQAIGVFSGTVKIARKLTNVLAKIEALNYQYAEELRYVGRDGWKYCIAIDKRLAAYDKAAHILADLLPY